MFLFLSVFFYVLIHNGLDILTHIKILHQIRVKDRLDNVQVYILFEIEIIQ